METITLKINGKDISCLPGKTVLEAAEHNGIYIPTLCSHPDLEPAGACRLCLVEDVKRGRMMASCVAPAAQDMVIQTDSPRIANHRRNIIRLMMAEHPESCIVCNKGNRCRLRRIAGEIGVGETELYPMPHYTALEEANPFIVRDLSKCILCGRCIRADQDLVVVGAIDYNLRGFKSRPAALHELPLEKSSCTFCGTCISMCPTGALMAKNTQYVGSPQHESATVCGFCAVGCSLMMGTADGKVVEVNPSNMKNSVNRSTLCVRGHFAHDFLNSRKRLTHPLIRKEDALTPVSWDEALDRVANRFSQIKKNFGPMSIGFMGSSKCSNEENYLFQKIARVILETNNIDNNGYPAGGSVMRLIDDSTDGGWRVNHLSALEKTDAIVAFGANPSHSLPVVSYFIKRAVRKGIPLIVVDPRRTDLVPFASVWLPILPGKDMELVNCLSALIWKKFAHDANYMERFVANLPDFTHALSLFNPERLCVEAGVEMKALDSVIDQLTNRKIAFVIGQGVLQQKNAVLSMKAILNLSMLTGSLGNKKGGIYVLAKENNQMGAADMGVVPDCLPGGSAVNNDSERRQWEKNWGVGLCPDSGLDMVRMIEEAENGNLKGLFILGENPIRSLPQPERVQKALEKVEFLVVQDILETETVQMAHAVIPGAAFSEKDGSFTNIEGRIQSFKAVVPPPGEAKPDWEILDLLYSRMGLSDRYGTLEKIRAEIRQWVPLYGGLGRNGDVSWLENQSRMALYRPEGKGRLLSFFPITAGVNGKYYEGYDYKAILGSNRYHLGSGTRTSHSPRIGNFNLKGEIEMSFEDSALLDVTDGDCIRLSSPWGFMERPVKTNKTLASGIVFIPMAFSNNDVMRLIPLVKSTDSEWPSIKECPVRIEKR